MTLKEMVKRSGATPRTIRFYEEVGLVHPLGRTPGGHRVYHPRELEKLQLITDLRDAGLSLEEIKELFELKRAAGDARAASRKVAGVLEAKIQDLERRIGVLTRLKTEFTSSVDIFQVSCALCRCPAGQETCETCTDVDRSRLPRTFRWLWDVH